MKTYDLLIGENKVSLTAEVLSERFDEWLALQKREVLEIYGANRTVIKFFTDNNIRVANPSEMEEVSRLLRFTFSRRVF